MKYLGVITPFKGLRVYTRAAMGMPGSTEHLDELMSRVMGDLMHEGKVIKLQMTFTLVEVQLLTSSATGSKSYKGLNRTTFASQQLKLLFAL